MLKSPIPKKKYYGVKETEFKKLNKIYLPFFERKDNYFIELLQKRSSKRVISNNLSLLEISPILWFTFKIRDSIKDNNILFWQKQYIPTSGGIGCISPLIINIKDYENNIFIYSGEDHSLIEIDLGNFFINTIKEVVFNMFDLKNNGTILIYIADIVKINKKYKNAESLIWRDVGVVNLNINLLCDLYEYKSCILGYTFDNELENFKYKNFNIVGAQIIGY
jgi:SagB-type dehydrogenase family enzyme